MADNNGSHDVYYDGRLTYIKIDRLPDEKTKDAVPGKTYLKVTGMGKVIEKDGKIYLEVPKWKAERF